MIIRKLLRSDEEGVSRTQKTISLSLASTVTTVLNLLLSMAAASGEKKLSRALPSPERLAGELADFRAPLHDWVRGKYGDRVPRGERDSRTPATNESALVALMSSLLFCVFICGGRESVFS